MARTNRKWPEWPSSWALLTKCHLWKSKTVSSINNYVFRDYLQLVNTPRSTTTRGGEVWGRPLGTVGKPLLASSSSKKWKISCSNFSPLLTHSPAGLPSDKDQGGNTKQPLTWPLADMLSAAELIKKAEAWRVVVILDEAYKLGLTSSKSCGKPCAADMHKTLMKNAQAFQE